MNAKKRGRPKGSKARYGRIVHFFEEKVIREEGLSPRIEESLDFKKYSGERCNIVQLDDGSLEVRCFGLTLKVPKGYWTIRLKDIGMESPQ